MKNNLHSSFLLSLWVLSFVLVWEGTSAQSYSYTVSTLIPANTHLLDDGICLDEKGVIYGSYWGIWQGATGTHVGRLRPDGSMDTLSTGYNHPNGMSYKDGTLYLANSGQSQVVTIDTNGNSQVIAGVPGVSNVIPVLGTTDSLVAVAWQGSRFFGIRNGNVTTLATGGGLNGPVGMAYDTAGNLYVGNFNNGRILHYQGNGQFTTIADIGGGSGFITYSDGAILATNHSNKRVYRVDLADSSVSVIAGSGQAVMADGEGTNASFASPNGIVATPSGDTIYVSEFQAKALRMIVRTPVITAIEAAMQPEVVVYPVPTFDRLRFGQDLPEDLYQVFIYDMEGRLIEVVENPQDGIDTSGWGNGIYQVVGMNRIGKALFQIKVPKSE